MLFNTRKKLILQFLTHAPEPPAWFGVEMTTKPPELPGVHTIKEDADRELARQWIDSNGSFTPATDSEDLKGFMQSYERAVLARQQWQMAMQEDLYFRWRVGYATKMANIFRGIK